MASFRGFFSKLNFQPHATSSAYIEIQTPQTDRSTKVSCSIYGPMARMAGDGNSSQEQCYIKVNIDFNDSKISESLILQQNTDAMELIEIQTSTIQSEVASGNVKERKIQQIIGNIKQQIENILKSTILSHKYSGLTIQFSFHIYEIDQDFLQALVNCSSMALLKSGIECKGLPAAITMLIKPERKQLLKKETLLQFVEVDPTVQELKVKDQYSHKMTLVGLRGSDELIFTSLAPLGKAQPLDLGDMELLMGLGLSLTSDIHNYIVSSIQA